MIIKQELSAAREKPPVGSHLAICNRIIDLGTQETSFEGVVGYKHKLLIGWELCHEMLSEGDFAGQPFVVTRQFAVSMNEKSTLRKFLKSWRGRDFTDLELQGFDLKAILGKPCMLSIIESEKGYRNVDTVMTAPKGMQIPDAQNHLIDFDLSRFDQGVYEVLPKWIKEIIGKSPEFQSLGGGYLSTSSQFPDVLDDDTIPF